jgi:hypothetical protein
MEITDLGHGIKLEFNYAVLISCYMYVQWNRSLVYVRRTLLKSQVEELHLVQAFCCQSLNLHCKICGVLRTHHPVLGWNTWTAVLGTCSREEHLDRCAWNMFSGGTRSSRLSCL